MTMQAGARAASAPRPWSVIAEHVAGHRVLVVGMRDAEPDAAEGIVDKAAVVRRPSWPSVRKGRSPEL
jgi:hypothetical protein